MFFFFRGFDESKTWLRFRLYSTPKNQSFICTGKERERYRETTNVCMYEWWDNKIGKVEAHRRKQGRKRGWWWWSKKRPFKETKLIWREKMWKGREGEGARSRSMTRFELGTSTLLFDVELTATDMVIYIKHLICWLILGKSLRNQKKKKKVN